MAAGLLAKKAVERGLQTPPWVKTSLAPGSKVVTDYCAKAGLLSYLDKLGSIWSDTAAPPASATPVRFPLKSRRRSMIKRSGRGLGAFAATAISKAASIRSSRQLPDVAAAGGGICPGRAHGHRSAERSARSRTKTASPFTWSDIWPTQREVDEAVQQISSEMFRKSYAEVYRRRRALAALPVPQGQTYVWEPDSTYIRQPPYFDDMNLQAGGDRGHPRCARACCAGRQRDDGPHFAGGLHQEGQPGREIPDGAWREACGLQLLRLAPWQSRGDGARHIRQRAPAQPAGAGHRGRLHTAPARRDEMSIYDASAKYKPRASRW